MTSIEIQERNGFYFRPITGIRISGMLLLAALIVKVSLVKEYLTKLLLSKGEVENLK